VQKPISHSIEIQELEQRLLHPAGAYGRLGDTFLLQAVRADLIATPTCLAAACKLHRAGTAAAFPLLKSLTDALVIRVPHQILCPGEAGFQMLKQAEITFVNPEIGPLFSPFGFQ
jgi:hypothetical protein